MKTKEEQLEYFASKAMQALITINYPNDSEGMREQYYDFDDLAREANRYAEEMIEYLTNKKNSKFCESCEGTGRTTKGKTCGRCGGTGSGIKID